jgi:hypothetical protein
MLALDTCVYGTGWYWIDVNICLLHETVKFNAMFTKAALDLIFSQLNSVHAHTHTHTHTLCHNDAVNAVYLFIYAYEGLFQEVCTTECFRPKLLSYFPHICLMSFQYHTCLTNRDYKLWLNYVVLSIPLLLFTFQIFRFSQRNVCESTSNTITLPLNLVGMLPHKQ